MLVASCSMLAYLAMANVVNPPSNPFRRAMMRGLVSGSRAGGIGTGGTGGTGGTDRTGTPFANPATGSALSDPSLNQQFSGPFAGLAQFGQVIAQHRAFKQEQQSVQDTTAAFQQHLQDKGDVRSALIGMLKDDPAHFNVLVQNPNLLNTLMRLQDGGTQVMDLGGGSKLVVGVDPTGKGFSHVVQPQNNTLHPIGVSPAGNVVAGTRAGGTQELTGVTPTPVATAETRGQIAATKPQKPNWDAQHNRYVFPPDASGNIRTQSPEEPTVNVTNPNDKRYLSNVENLHRAISDMSALSSDVSGVLTGKIKTFIGGKVLGTNDPALLWNDAHNRAENAIASMNPVGSGGSSSIFKERIANLPRDWQSYSQNKVVSAGWLQDLRNEAAQRAGFLEANGKLPDINADALARVGVFTKKYAPQISQLQNNPETMGEKELKALGPYMKYADPDLRDAWTARTQAVLANRAQQVTTPQPQQQQVPQQPATPQTQRTDYIEPSSNGSQ